VLVSTSRGPPWRCSQSGSLRSSPPSSSSTTTSLRRPRPGAAVPGQSRRSGRRARPRHHGCRGVPSPYPGA
jgi:hypothetical protein